MQHETEQRSLSKGNLPAKLNAFFKTEAAGGVVMLLSAILALLLANSPWSEAYFHFTHYPLTLALKDFTLSTTLTHVVNDGFMILFFLLIGLELKREMSEGFLTQRNQILLPLIAAICGMAFPALLYLLINQSSPATLHGWAIPSATDIAFAITVLNIWGKGIPPALKIFLLAVAIFDDIGAILIICTFYSSAIALFPLGCAALCIGLLYLCHRKNITSITLYLTLGGLLAIALFYSGIHTTLAGVITGIAIPMRDKHNLRYSPVNRCIHKLHVWVSFAILPLFAFCASGIDMRNIALDMLFSPVPLGILCGLFFGKQIGIFGSAWLLIKSKRIAMPENATWLDIYAISVLTGIGFTMSLFIGLLAFQDPAQTEAVKLGVIMGTSLSMGWGIAVFRFIHYKNTPFTHPPHPNENDARRGERRVRATSHRTRP